MTAPDCRLRRAIPMVFMLMAATFVGCGAPPTTPSPPPTPPITPPAVVTPPTIKALSIGATRTEVDREVTLTADVEDAEKAPAALTYIWSADVGTFSGSGMSVTWRLPKGATPTPVNVVIRLTVVEPYQVLENGQLVNREHRVTRDAEPVRVHDSAGEITRMVRTFLIDYFGNIKISPDACLVDFSDNCVGKAEERNDIVGIRADFSEIIEVRVDSVAVVLHSSTRADASAPCVFRSVHKMTGYEPWGGDCDLTAVYEQQRWWLCSSHFNNEVRLPSGVGDRVTRPKATIDQLHPGTFPFYFR